MELQSGYKMLVSLELIRKLNQIYNHLYNIWHLQNILLNQKSDNSFNGYKVNSKSHDCRTISTFVVADLKKVNNYDNFSIQLL